MNDNMNNNLRKRWVAALRSGEYEQGKERLRSGGDEYCCLGVLCDIVINDSLLNGTDRYLWDGRPYSEEYTFVDIDHDLWRDDIEHEDYEINEDEYTFTEHGSLTQSVITLIGLRSDTGVFDNVRINDWGLFGELSESTNTLSLAILNDKGFTFEQIADIIENETEALFNE